MYFYNSYFSFIFLFILALVIALVLYLISFLLGRRILEKEKVSAYECGFSPFDDARQKFDIRFYLVSILFIIFDLEVVFLFPWSIVLFSINFFGFFTMFIFLFVLTVGFVYEWVNGALDWE